MVSFDFRGSVSFGDELTPNDDSAENRLGIFITVYSEFYLRVRFL